MKILYICEEKNISEEKTSIVGKLEVEQIPLQDADHDSLKNADVFLIDSHDYKYAETACKTIRRNSVPSIYLRPVIAVNTKDVKSSLIKSMTDEWFTEKATSILDIRSLTETCIKINREIEKLSELNDAKDTGIAQKILRYVFTRQRDLTPFRNSQCRFGLHYPEVETFLTNQDETLLHILDFLENQHLLTSVFFEKIHQCNHCSSSFLNFIEICPQCSSGDLETDDLIHHFHCAHVAPAAQFKRKGSYVCPKCDKELGGLGVDYDKPSAVYRCNNCRHISQEPEISTTCFHCGIKSLPEDLVMRTVKNYNLSALGENAAIHGIDIMFQQILDQAINILPYQSFKIFLESEIERIKRYNISKSSIILFHISEFDKLYEQIGNRSKEIFGEMGIIMKSVLRTCDITTIMNETTFISLLPETNNDGAIMAIGRLKEKFIHLFEDNLKREIDIITNTLELSGSHNVNGVLSEIVDAGTTD